MKKSTARDVDLVGLYEASMSNLNLLEANEVLRNNRGLVFPQDIELQLRNLKEAYHKITLMCAERVKSEIGMRPIVSKRSLGADFGTPPNTAEWAAYASHLKQLSPEQFAQEFLCATNPVPARDINHALTNAHDAGSQDWSGANPSFNPHAGE